MSIQLVPIEEMLRTCEICEYKSIVAIQEHHVVPKKFGGSWSEKKPICCNCHKEVHALIKEHISELRNASNDEKLRICTETFNQFKNERTKLS